MSDRTAAAERRDPAIVAIATGVGLLCAGMALAIAGVVVGALFLPGAILIALGILACAVAALLRLKSAPIEDGTPAQGR